MTTRAEGTGLGLAIVAKIFEDHGGGVELLDAAVGGHDTRGAHVRLFFPLPPSGEAVSARVAAEPITLGA